MIKTQCTTQMLKLYQLAISIDYKADSNTDTHNPILRFTISIVQNEIPDLQVSTWIQTQLHLMRYNRYSISQSNSKSVINKLYTTYYSIKQLKPKDQAS